MNGLSASVSVQLLVYPRCTLASRDAALRYLCARHVLLGAGCSRALEPTAVGVVHCSHPWESQQRWWIGESGVAAADSEQAWAAVALTMPRVHITLPKGLEFLRQMCGQL